MDRKPSINSTQKDMLVQFLKDHEDLQTGRFTNEFTFKKAQTLWEEVTTTLNSVPNGAQKDWRQWRKTWQDLKKNAKSKAVAAKKHATGTGGGEPAKPLSDVDSEILEIMNPVQIEGLNIVEAPVNFTFNKENKMQEALGAAEIILDYEQPSTSKIHDHEYVTPNLMKTPKKMNRTTRLTQSLNISNRLLRSVDNRNLIMDEYYQEKIKYLKIKSAYLDKKSDFDSQMVSTLIDIKNILKDYSSK